MKNRQLLAAALALCLASSGCLAVANCGDGCGRGCSMAFQKYDCSCDGVCGECCGAGASGGCDDSCTGGCDTACEPPLRRLMGRMWGCTGCGECYWNEWHNDPPRVCEPCDRCGNYTGPGKIGYYQAPYRRHDFHAANPQPHVSSVPRLELAEEPYDEEIME